jgi:O-antigen ligase
VTLAVPGGLSERISVAGSVVLAAVAVGGIATRNVGAAAGLATAMVVLGAFARRRACRLHGGSRYSWISWAWIALLLVSSVKLSERDTTAAVVGNASPENVLELATYAAVAIGVIGHAATTPQLRTSRMGVYAAWILVAVASTLWSLIPLFTFVRSSQLLVLIGLALITADIGCASPAEGRALVRRTLRAFVLVVFALTILGFAVRDWPEGRFAWPGTHEITVALMVTTALVVVAAGRRITGFSGVFTLVCSITLIAALVVKPTRTAIIAALAALAVLLLRELRASPGLRRVALLYQAIVITAAAFVFLPRIGSYLTRGEGTDALTTLNGRVPLWAIVLEQFETPRDWLLGFGYGASRVLLPTEVAWGAGDAHSAWAELLLGTGLVGVAAAVFSVVALVRGITRRNAEEASQRLLLLIAVLLLVASLATPTFVIPGFGATLFAFLAATTRISPVPSPDGGPRLLQLAPVRSAATT